MPVNPAFTVYRDQLSQLSHGLALWNPDPPKNIYNNVSVGDVGYVHEGTFIRMFNVMLPWSDPLPQPEPYTPLDLGPFINIRERRFAGGEYYSRSVTVEANAKE